MSNRQTIAYSAMGLTDYFKQEPSEKFSGVHYYFNLLALGLAIASIIMYKKIYKNEKEKKFYIFLVILAISTIILMSQLIPWGILPQMVIMIQFAWRLESIMIIALSILAALTLRILKSNKSKAIWLTVILIFNGLTVYNAYDFDKIKVHNIEDIDVSYWGMGYEKEYLPEATINNMEYYDNRGKDIIIQSGNADINIEESKTPYLKATINNSEKNTAIELPRIYYLGYKATLIAEDGTKEDLNLYINGNGFVETVVNKDGTLILEYSGTILQKIANTTCIVTILVLVFVIIYKIRKNKTQEN